MLDAARAAGLVPGEGPAAAPAPGADAVRDRDEVMPAPGRPVPAEDARPDHRRSSGSSAGDGHGDPSGVLVPAARAAADGPSEGDARPGSVDPPDVAVPTARRAADSSEPVDAPEVIVPEARRGADSSSGSAARSTAADPLGEASPPAQRDLSGPSIGSDPAEPSTRRGAADVRGREPSRGRRSDIPPRPHARPRIVDDPAILGLSRVSRGRVGSRLFTWFFVFVFTLIAVQMVVSILTS